MEWWMCCVLALVLASLSGHSRGKLSVSIQEPGGPFISSGPVRLQIEFSRNITLVNTHTYEIDCTSGIGTRPIWTGDGIQIPSSQPPMGTSGAYVTEDTDRKSTLVLQNLIQSLVGTYVCQEGSEQDADSATLVITIGNPTVVPGVPQLALVAQNYETRPSLHALISATPPPQGSDVSWFFSGNQIAPGNEAGFLIVGPTEILFPRHVTRTLNGTYTCVVNTTAGVENATFRVEVQTPPVLVPPGSFFYAAVNSTVILNFTIQEAKPPVQAANISWSFNNRVINTNSSKYMQSVTPNGQIVRLTIRNLMLVDTGQYQASVSHEALITALHITINLRVKLPPSLTIDPAMLVHVVVAGASITIACTDTVGILAPTFTWTHNGNPVSSGRRITITGNGVLQSSRLTITSLVPEDKGTYQCRAVNPAASDTESIQVDVQYAPILSRVSRNLTTWMTGEDVLLSAVLNGANPHFTTYQVTRDSQVLTDGRIAVTYTNESGSPTFGVRIAHVAVSDEGTYTLEVTNTIGTGRVNFTVVVIVMEPTDSTSVPVTTTAYFQLRLKPVTGCATWVDENRSQKVMDIVSAVVQSVQGDCSCNFTATNIPNFEFSCRSIANTVVFRAEIIYTNFGEGPYTADDIVALMSTWAQSGTSISVDSTRLDVDPSCPTRLESFQAGDCESETVTGSVNVAVLGGTVGAVCVLLIAVSIIVVVTLVQRTRKRKIRSHKNIDETYELPQLPASDTSMVKCNPGNGKFVPSRPDHIATESNPAYGHVRSSRLERDEEEDGHTYETIPYDQPGH